MYPISVRLGAKAAQGLNDAQSVLDSLQLHLTKQQVNDVTKKVMEGTSHVLDYLGAVASAHPVAQMVVTVLTGVVNMELTRHENNAHIVVVHATMMNTVYHVGFLTEVQRTIEEDVNGKLHTIVGSMAKTIGEFGAFVDAYHTRWQKTYKVLFSAVHRKKLEHFSKTFEQHREELNEMRKTLTQLQLTTIIDNTSKILSRLQFLDQDMKAAEEFVRSNGGPDAVRQNPELVDKVAGMVHEKATAGMKETLSQGFEELLKNQTARYLKKLESVQDAVSASRVAILDRLNEGPHKLIEDRDLQSMWQSNQWKAIVKGRLLIEGLHEHYQRQFHTSSGRHEDAWTLQFFSRVMYHSAIGDAMDDDGSGYISVSEFNEFISARNSLNGWTNPQWFAFWACGWYNNNTWYHHRIKQTIQEIEQSVHSSTMPDRSQKSWLLVQDIVKSLKILVLVADVEDVTVTSGIPHQLRRLQEEYRTHEEIKIAKNLAHFGSHLTDRISIHCAVGDSRIELHVMPLLYLLMVHLRETVSKMVHSSYVEDADLIAMEELATSCIAVFVAFEDRMRELIRGWRSEGKDIDKQVDRYADGLFKKCYREANVYENAYESLRGGIFGEDHTMPRHLTPHGSRRSREQSVHVYEKAYESLRGETGSDDRTLSGHLTPPGSRHSSEQSVEELSRNMAALSERLKALEMQMSASPFGFDFLRRIVQMLFGW
ncbi:hypothetical protein OH77DRAFT_1428198 [Trametes cingulata]|nr:hypothetical protein OH77DRAFT_1428198 [Trametes cingulata]